MSTRLTTCNVLLALLVVAAFAIQGCDEPAAKEAGAKPPKMKMTTETPPGIATRDKVETRVGKFTLRDGVPDLESTEQMYEYRDLHNGVHAYLSGI